MIAETICSAASAAGVGIAAVTAYRRRFLAAARITAYALVPIGLVLTGVVEWVAGIAFEPSVWLGFVLLGAAWLLFVGTRATERRRGPARERRKAARRGEEHDRLAPAAPSRAADAGRRSGAAPGEKPRGDGTAQPGDDFSDIEAILKKHGL
ncbi:hypothetical protein OG233_26560 [Streptomyces sp. NBC_01218]|uniref:hypothetical protein n=1 Tax=unclassified Streptomyces TaxID=2593676 RepID=UPI0023B9A35A|nr:MULTISPECIES: hypothetical protein [unclassified Streptomyces]WEH42787.1 hypothetical protein PZB77_26630 [Streptomyces sp. AM 2-1-1]WSQ54423.1 hypothetical protein OG233_26560 [Streptomyces sp. NBC_01218]